MSSMGTLLTILSLAVHLVAMNLASAGPLACAWLVGTKSTELAWPHRTARVAIAALVVGALAGGFLLVWPSDGMRAALLRFPSSTYWFAGVELLFSFVCMALLAALARRPKRKAIWVWILAVAAATNLLYHFPPLMTVIGKLAADPRWAHEAIITRHVLLDLIKRPEVLSLWLHFVLASVAGAAILAMCSGRGTPVDNGSEDKVAVRRFAAAALCATLLQLPVGAWVLLTSSAQAQDALMGQDWRATSCFAAGVLLAIGLLHALATISAGDVQPSARGRAAGLFVAIAVLMVATLVLSRMPDAPRVHEASRRAPPTFSQAP